MFMLSTPCCGSTQSFLHSVPAKSLVITIVSLIKNKDNKDEDNNNNYPFRQFTNVATASLCLEDFVSAELTFA